MFQLKLCQHKCIGHPVFDNRDNHDNHAGLRTHLFCLGSNSSFLRSLVPRSPPYYWSGNETCSVSTSLVLQIVRVLSIFSSIDSHWTVSLVKIHICYTKMVLLTCCQMLQMSSLLCNRALGLVCSHQSVQCIDWFVSVKWSLIVILDWLFKMVVLWRAVVK